MQFVRFRGKQKSVTSSNPVRSSVIHGSQRPGQCLPDDDMEGSREPRKRRRSYWNDLLLVRREYSHQLLFIWR